LHRTGQLAAQIRTVLAVAARDRLFQLDKQRMPSKP